jgi:pimeloyl-ACP methyl ester carboxylesterase
MKTSLIMALLLGSSFAFAQQDYKCDFEGVRSVKVPVYPDRPDSKQFNYHYQLIGDLDPEKIVIINLPGGPGGSSMNDFSIPQVKSRAVRGGLPENIPWIMIDPRTSGCNRATEEQMPDDSLNSTNLAHDVLSVIETLKLKKYIIHGHSYGSQHGTFVAGLAKQRGLPAPHALFLSGILGRGEKDGSFSIPFNLILEWNLIKATLSPKAQAILNSPSPLGYEDWEWEAFISSGLYSGYELYEGKFKNFFIELLALIDEDDPAKREALHKELRPDDYVRYGYSSNSRRLYKKVDCHEFSPDDGHTLFVNGSLVFDAENNPCKDEPFDRPYDSADFEITSPIYYLAGTNDPAAPYKGAVYHFDNQVQAQRNFITVNGGGHMKLGYVLGDCRNEIWNAIFQQKNLDDVIPNCKADIKLEIRD